MIKKVKRQNIFILFENWAKEHSFWADTIRTVILGGLGAYLVATYLEKIKNDTAFEAEVSKARLTAQVDAIREFASKSYQFTLSANRYKEDGITYNELRNHFDNFRIAKHQFYVLTDNKEMAESDDDISALMLRLLKEKTNLKNMHLPNAKSNEPQDGFEQVRQLIKEKSDLIELNALSNLKSFK